MLGLPVSAATWFCTRPKVILAVFLALDVVALSGLMWMIFSPPGPPPLPNPTADARTGRLTSQSPAVSSSAKGLAGMPSRRGNTVASLNQQLNQACRAHDYPGIALAAKQLIELDPGAPDPYYCMSCVEAVGGRTEEAIAYMTKAVERGFIITKHIREDIDLASIASDPRFVQLIARSNLRTSPGVPR